MAEIRPFRALRYDPAQLALQDVITQPYDKITPEMQSGYYQRSPANFIRFELPRGVADAYGSAHEFLAQMRRQGAILLEDRPAMYVYEQTFRHPVQPAKTYVRRALIAVGRLHDYDAGVIFRHEQTLTGPKRDREQLLKTARVQSGLLFMLYDDPRQTLEQLQAGELLGEFTDDLGIGQRLTRITDPAALNAVQESVAPLPLFIADGHHRYETALSLRRSRDGRFAEDFAMMALVNMRSEGLIVLATHRTIFGLAPDSFAAGWQRLRSELDAHTIGNDAAVVDDALRSTAPERFACVIAIAGESWLIDVDRAELQYRCAGGSCELDVEALHEIFAHYFGISAADVTAQRNVRYHRYPDEALKDVATGAQAAFLIRPVSVETIRDRSLRGALMPQKSTDFFPKMNSGLTLYSWDESFATPQGAQ